MSEAKNLKDLEEESPMTSDEGENKPSVEKKPKWYQKLRSPKRREKKTRSVSPSKIISIVKRTFFLSFKYSFYLVATILVLFVSSYNAARLYFTDNKIKNIVTTIFTEQTGGRLDIEKLRMNLLTGISISGLTVFVDEKNESSSQKPLLKLQKIDLSYSLSKLLTGRIHISAVKLVKPEIYVRQDDGVFNFNKILEYRTKHFPSVEDTTKEESPPQSDSPSTAQLSTLKSLLFFMPIEIMIHDIGVTNLNLINEIYKNGSLIDQTDIGGASIDLGAYWFKTSSSFWVSLTAPFEHPFTMKVSKAPEPSDDNTNKENLGSKNQSALKSQLSMESAHTIRLELLDFSRLNIDIASRIPELKAGNISYKDASIFSRGRIKVSDDLKKLSIEQFDNHILDAISYNLKSDVTLTTESFDKFLLQSEQNLQVDLKKVSEIIQPFVPDIKLDGRIHLEKLLVNGDLDLQKMEELQKAIGLPAVSGILWLENIKAQIPKSGLDMLPISGRISVSSSPKAAQDGVQADLSLDLTMPKLTLTQNIEKLGHVEAGVKGLSVKLISRLVWPDAVVPILNLDVEAEKVTAHSPLTAPVDEPLYFNLNAEGDKELSEIALNESFQLGNLAEISINGTCQESCSRFRSSILARLDSLKRLHAIALPMKGKLLPEEFMPSSLDGVIDLQFNTKGQIPNPLKNPVSEILKLGDLRFNLQANASKLSAKVPFMDLNIKSLENRIIANGDLKEQNFELAQKFNHLSLHKEIQPSSGAPNPSPLNIKLEKYSFDFQVKNEFSGLIDLDKPIKNMSTQVLTWFYLGKIEAPGILPKPLGELSFETDFFQNRLHDVSINNISFRSPDYGLNVKISADSQLDENYMPTNFHTAIHNLITHNGNENLPGGIKTIGRLDTKIELGSNNMTEYNIDGHIGFDKFSFFLIDQKDKDKKKISIEDISGEMPLKQKVKLPHLHEILAFLEKKPVKADPSTQVDKKPLEATPTVVNIAQSTSSDADSEGNLSSSITQYLDKTKDKLKDNTNAMAIVDYGTVRPFYPSKRPISIRRIDVANLELSNLEFDIELKQNWFALNQYIISFLGGKIQGAFLLAFDASLPKIDQIASDAKKIPKNIRTSVHLTRLDTRKLLERFPNLKGKGESLIPVFSNPYLDGTVHLSYDLLTNELGGGIEITSIGKEQLKMMLYYVDPFEQNPTISDIRGALEIGEVRQVSIPLKSGEIGMDVDVRVLGAPIPTPKLTRFPISQIIGNFMNQSSQKEEPAEENKEEPKKSSAYNLEMRSHKKTWEKISQYASPT